MSDLGTRLGIVVGLQREAEAIREILGSRACVVCAGADPLRAEHAAARLVEDGAGVLLSIGYAGALSPDLESGSIVLADEVIAGGGAGRYRAPPQWISAVERRLSGVAPVMVGPLAGSDVILEDAEAKRDLWLATGCIAVDMESHAVARTASRFQLPFGVIRVILDDAETVVPGWLGETVTPDGATEWPRLVREIARQPLSVPTLMRLARHERRAAHILRAAVERLGGGVSHEPGIP